MPENWVLHPVVNTEEGSNPGAPLAWGSPENPDDAVAGYGYVPCDTSEVEETFYYHSDHLGSTAYITDQQANVTQYDAYLPYGELLVDEHSSSADLPYKFNGKELDEETGLYYYGARYMNPLTSMWYGVDPLCEQYVASGAYVYCVGNPIKLIDNTGCGWEETSTISKNGDVTVNITLTVAFLNSSDKKFDLNKLHDVLESQLNNSYGNAGNGFKSPTKFELVDRKSGMDNFKLSKLLISSEYKKINVNVTVKSRIIKDESERNKGEHLLRIENDRDMKGLYGQGKIGGLLVRINAKYLSNILNGRDDNTLPHEFGHTLGLLHVDGLDAYFMGLFTPNQYMNRMEQSKDPYNMMFSGKSPYMNDKKSVKINLNQLQIIINNIRNNKVNHE